MCSQDSEITLVVQSDLFRITFFDMENSLPMTNSKEHMSLV